MVFAWDFAQKFVDIPRILGKFLNKLMKPLFNVNGEGSFALIMGILSGYPVGAKIAVNFRKYNILPKEECERLLSFTNNSGPLFIIGTVGISIFGSSTIGILLLSTHILASLTVGFLFKFWKRSNNTTFNTTSSYTNNSKYKLNFSTLGETLADSITSATSTILMIGGFVVIFSVIISIFEESHIISIISKMLSPTFSIFNIPNKFVSPLLIGILEITNGICLIASVKIKKLSLNIIFTAFLLGIGGLSILLQVFSITSKTDLSIKPYILGKILQGFIAALYTFIFIQIFPFFNFNL